MYHIEDLFDKRSIVGSKLEQFLQEKSYTKSKFCEATGISRPTLDKLLAGTLTSKTNYEKHISKVLNYLSITPDLLLGNVQNEHSRARAIRNMMKITSEQLSEDTGISQERLHAIESGEEATVAELRDIARCLSTSVRGVLGTNFFGIQVATMEYFLGSHGEKEVKDLSGFWGHMGVLPTGQDTCLWFPITGATRNMIYRLMDEKYMVVPCMNNKVLLLNMKNIKELILLDEACDQPGFANWDSGVDCGEIPLVVYDALDDYLAFYNGEKISDDILSPSFQELLQAICSQNGWTDEDINGLIHGLIIHFQNGKTQYTEIDFYNEETISDAISDIYDFNELEENVLYFSDYGGAELIVNMRNISFMELPLLKLEEAICKKMDEAV